MSEVARLRALEVSGLLHPNAPAVTAVPFREGGFFLAQDKVQVKYEMLRVQAVEEWDVSAAAAVHGYSRSAFYLVKAAFEAQGMAGLLDGKPGRRGPVKVTEGIVAFIRAAPKGTSGAVLADGIEQVFGVLLHRRTVERIQRP
ncbi:helix-turn-helix domain-containing protein [Streptomyces sp. G-G2]|uniref:helix-turn-helix domain-containing protein n=1 Tax=Streptomyces sp. G-G2 TaxID=3046201 RepID=UPI0024BB5D05|nr:helix-turn-helix domain-containing protein [Streptomyces sp. G-G2]MDJ0385829.1 helix-turn-helix domain-containing protein [Streptomyces sp. G-G2]